MVREALVIDTGVLGHEVHALAVKHESLTVLVALHDIDGRGIDAGFE